MLCTWIPICCEPGLHRVARETRPGLVLDDTVCDKHLVEARRHGYRVLKTLEPESAQPEGHRRRP